MEIIQQVKNDWHGALLLNSPSAPQRQGRTKSRSAQARRITSATPNLTADVRPAYRPLALQRRAPFRVIGDRDCMTSESSLTCVYLCLLHVILHPQAVRLSSSPGIRLRNDNTTELRPHARMTRRVRTGLPSGLVRRRGAAAGAAGRATAGQPLQAAVATGQWRPALRIWCQKTHVLHIEAIACEINIRVGNRVPYSPSVQSLEATLTVLLCCFCCTTGLSNFIKSISCKPPYLPNMALTHSTT